MAKILSDKSIVKCGDVVLVSLDPTIGSETKKTRPCLLIEAGRSPLNLVIALPITDNQSKRKSPIFVSIEDLPLAGLSKPSAIDCYQIRTMSVERISKRLGQVNESVMSEVKNRLAVVLDIGEENLFQPSLKE
jgi:mRNA interferase MazF